MNNFFSKKYNFFLCFVIFLCFLALFSSCSSVPSEKATRIKPIYYSSLDNEPFFVQNENLFIKRHLSNGIPVVIKKSINQKDCSINLVINSLENEISQTKSGIAEVTLDLLKCGTQKYNSNYIQSLSYAESINIKSFVHNDYYEYRFVCPKEKINSYINVFSESFKTPLLSSSDFEKIIELKIKDLTENINEKALLELIYNYLNKDGSYINYPFYSTKSKINFKDVVNFHNSLLNANRIMIFVSGNFSDTDIPILYETLNQNFGKIKSKAIQKKQATNNSLDFNKISAINFSIEENSLTINSSKNKKNILGLYNIPLYCSSEYINYAIASLLIDDLFYKELKSNAIQDIGTGNILGNPNIGVISIYGATLDFDYKNLLERLLNKMSIEYINSNLGSIKDVYTSFIMSTELSSEKTVNQMTRSFIYNSDATNYIRFPFYINRATCDQVKMAIDNSIKKGIAWFSVE